MPRDHDTTWPSRAELTAWANQPLADQQRAELEAYGQILTPSTAQNTRERAVKSTKTAVRIIGQKRGTNRTPPEALRPSTSLPAAISGRLTTEELRDLITQAEQQARDQATQHAAPQTIRWERLSPAQLEQIAACRTQDEVDSLLARWSTQNKGG